MKRYQMLMLEWGSKVPVLEDDAEMQAINPGGIGKYSDTRKGAMLGAGIGLGGSAIGWFIRKKKLNQELENCNGDPQCEAIVRRKIESLSHDTMGRGA